MNPEDYQDPDVLYQALVDRIRKYHPSADITLIEKAYHLAKEAHQDQVRKSGEPYLIHPMWVGIIVNCINIVLNFLLIYDTRTVSLLGLRFAIPGAGWGVTGAAAASALSYVWGGIHITWVLWRHPLVSPKGMSLKPDMGRFVDSEELLGGVFFLCDDKAASAITGVVLPIDAGFAAYSGV